MEKKYNLKSPAVKRLMREAMELKDPTHQYHAQPLEQDLFEWHFTVRGPPDTEFAGGQYHGRITFPAEYPMKPPNIILLTPNGRFEVGKKICLSMSAHHPETWQPSWSLRTVLLALIGFMPTKGAGAIGALDYTPEERKVLAARSCDWKCESCGIDHQSCLLEADPISTEHEKQENEEAKELASHFVFKGEGEKEKQKEPNKDIPSTPVNESTDQTSQLNGVENIQENSTEPDTALRQRVTATTTADGRSNPANSQNVPDETNMNNRTAASSMADNVSLILLWVVAALLVILILKRLSAGESSTISKSNY